MGNLHIIKDTMRVFKSLIGLYFFLQWNLIHQNLQCLDCSTAYLPMFNSSQKKIFWTLMWIWLWAIYGIKYQQKSQTRRYLHKSIEFNPELKYSSETFFSYKVQLLWKIFPIKVDQSKRMFVLQNSTKAKLNTRWSLHTAIVSREKDGIKSYFGFITCLNLVLLISCALHGILIRAQAVLATTTKNSHIVPQVVGTVPN